MRLCSLEALSDAAILAMLASRASFCDFRVVFSFFKTVIVFLSSAISSWGPNERTRVLLIKISFKILKVKTNLEWRGQELAVFTSFLHRCSWKSGTLRGDTRSLRCWLHSGFQQSSLS